MNKFNKDSSSTFPLNHSDNEKKKISSAMISQKKIGIVGWAGTGKTTFIVMLYYLLSGKIHDINIAYTDAETIRYLKSILTYINRSVSWEDFSNKMSGTIGEIPLNFKVKMKNKEIPIQLYDYRGEDIESDKDSKIVDSYLLKCDALMLFLPLNEIRDNSDYGKNDIQIIKRAYSFDRKTEFNGLLSKLSQQQNPIDIPIILVVTKYDQLRSSVSKSTQEALINEYLTDEMNMLRQYCKNVYFAVISSKECFEYYVLQNKREEEFPDYETDINPKNISIPFILILNKIIRKNFFYKFKKINWILKMLLGFALFFFLIYGGLGAYTYYQMNQIDLSSYTTQDNYLTFQNYTNYYRKSTSLFLFPFFQYVLKQKLEMYWNLAQEQDFNIFENAASDP